MARYTKEQLEDAVKQSDSVMNVLRILGYTLLSGGTHSHISRMIKKYEIDTSHFLGQAHCKGKPSFNKKNSDEILILSDGDRRESSFRLKRALLEIGREYKCEECNNIGIHNNKPLTLHIDHIDGNALNNIETNLRFLCPNCHSQTDNFGSKKIKKTKIKRKRNRVKKERVKKFYISKEELTKLVWELPTTKIAEMFDVTDNAIGKRCKLLDIEKPPRGYWTKKLQLSTNE